jgi:tetratricopeptide (TPR) repeat protein
MVALVGCVDQQTRQKLDSGEQSLAAKNFDGAIQSSDQALAANPTGPAAAEAYYVRGRAVEERPKPDASAAARDQARANADYQAALALNPPNPLAARIRSQLANLAYFREDYAAALNLWNEAIPGLDNPDWKATALYRVGVCEQRLGRWTDADRAFSMVIRDYPTSDAATRAAGHQGLRGFAVQVGAFSNPAAADNAVAAIQKAGAAATKNPERGLTVVRTGTVATYAEAKALKARLTGTYPDAVIVP